MTHRMRRFIILLICTTALFVRPAGAVGFQTTTVPDPPFAPLAVGIWYPSDVPAPAEPNALVHQALALNGSVSGHHLPLVIISHGKGGWLGGHADTAFALAEAGFVAVAVTHTGDNRFDETAPASRWMVDRPRHISRVIDYMLGHWSDHDRLDPKRIGIFGFSAGAYTALVSIGGVPDMAAAAAHCAADPSEFACTLGTSKGRHTARDWVHDPRIMAAVVVAPGFGFAFGGDALAHVTVPVQLWAASEDRNVPYRSNTAIVRRALPRPPDFHRVDGAGHFAFMQPCNPKLRLALPKIWEMVCVDPPGFDRARFHHQFNDAIVAFFLKSLSAP
ncbi:alpha/beta hydrolase family protein [Acidisoma cladoniae]|jgi:predicted dienelactone hydrolase|uniref:alpha/beta hydrolase family protein n=1 Tax=Acidisoma cladoniae TaxID=3040935 RepID=UPI00331367B9